LTKGAKERIGFGPNDGEDIFAHSFFGTISLSRKEIQERKFVDDYVPAGGDGVQAESLADSAIDEPITSIFPGMSRVEWKNKLELEFEPKQS
jgi:hypothetical protein